MGDAEESRMSDCTVSAATLRCLIDGNPFKKNLFFFRYLSGVTPFKPALGRRAMHKDHEPQAIGEG